MHRCKQIKTCFEADTTGRPFAIREVMPEVLGCYGLSMNVPEFLDICVRPVTTGNLIDFSNDKVDRFANCF